MKFLQYLFLSLIIFNITAHASATLGEDLFTTSKYHNAKISPDGKHIAVAMEHEGKTMLAIINQNDRQLVGSVNFTQKYEVGRYFWANNERIIIKLSYLSGRREDSQSFGELYAVNFDGSNRKLIYSFRNGFRAWADIIDLLPKDKKHILISSTPMKKSQESLSSPLLLNIYNGRIEHNHGRVPLTFSEFLTDDKGALKALTGLDANSEKKLYLRKNKIWQQVPENTVGKSVQMISIDLSGKHLYTIDNMNQDLFGIYRLNMETYAYENIFTDNNVDVKNALLDQKSKEIFAVKLLDGYPVYAIINNKLTDAKIFKKLLKIFPYNAISITSSSDNGEFHIVYISADNNPGKLYFYNSKKEQIELLFKFKPTFNHKLLKQTDPIEFTTSDGVKVHGYFTQAPPQNNDKPAPVVVLVHGGPHGIRDYWQFDPEVQYLALNGYSVLQINYRGSGGYGQNFETSGYNAWGTLIQRDIYEGYQWLVKKGKAIENNVCIMGASFGAYSAIQSATLYPETYQCAIANAGIYDLELMFEEGDIYKRKSGMSYLKKVLGTNKNVLKSISPVNYVEKIQIPLFIAHGEDDYRAPFKHAKRLRKALDKANKSYEWFTVDKEEHGFYNPENQKAYMIKVVSFLNQHLK